MGVTTKDLAKICGVSRTTVTRALYGGSIQDDTKNRILETARALGYQPDLLARSLVKGTSMTIGVIVVDLRNQYFPKMLDAIENTLKEYNYLLNITLHENSRETEQRLLQELIGHRVDGLIISPANQDRDFWEYLKNIPVPVVVIGNNLGDGISTVGIDEEQATSDAVSFILGKNYQNIVFVVPPLSNCNDPGNIGHRQRVVGYSKAMKASGLPEQLILGSDYIEQALNYMKNCTQRPAFLCSGDTYAIEVLSTLRQAGFTEVKDFGIMGFDCIDILQKWSPVLTTVDNHVEQIGRQSAELLLELISEKSSRKSIKIPHNMVSGETI